MEVNTIVELVDSVGFPIFVCIILFWFIKTYLDKFSNAIVNVNKSILDNTASIEKLVDKLEGK